MLAIMKQGGYWAEVLGYELPLGIGVAGIEGAFETRYIVS